MFHSSESFTAHAHDADELKKWEVASVLAKSDDLQPFQA